MLNWWPNKVVRTQHLWCFICQQHDIYGNARMGQQLGQLLRVGKEGVHSLPRLHNRTETVTTYISQKPLSFVWHWKASYPQTLSDDIYLFILLFLSGSTRVEGNKMQSQFCKWDENALNGFWVLSRWANHVIALWPVMKVSQSRM